MIASDPDQTVDVSLKLDGNKLEKPVFTFRFLTCRQVLAVQRLLKTARDSENGDQEACVRCLVDAVKTGMVGWRIPGDSGTFDPERLPDLLTPSELWELAYQTIDAVTLKEIDLGKSVSLSGSATGHSAPDALPAGSASSGAPN